MINANVKSLSLCLTEVCNNARKGISKT